MSQNDRTPFGLTLSEIALCALQAKLSTLPFHYALAVELENAYLEKNEPDPWTILFAEHYQRLKMHTDAVSDALAELVDRAAMAGMDVEPFVRSLDAYNREGQKQ